MLDRAIRTTNRRVNALEFVIQPKITNTIKYIENELGLFLIVLFFYDF